MAFALWWPQPVHVSLIERLENGTGRTPGVGVGIPRKLFEEVEAHSVAVAMD